MEAGASSLCMRSDGGDSDRLYFYKVLHRASDSVKKHKVFLQAMAGFRLVSYEKNINILVN